MEIKMPDGSVLVSENEEVIDSYINHMGGTLVDEKKTAKKSASKVASAKDAEQRKGGARWDI